MKIFSYFSGWIKISWITLFHFYPNPPYWFRAFPQYENRFVDNISYNRLQKFHEISFLFLKIVLQRIKITFFSQLCNFNCVGISQHFSVLIFFFFSKLKLSISSAINFWHSTLSWKHQFFPRWQLTCKTSCKSLK